jgi:Uncharacterized conserved protein
MVMAAGAKLDLYAKHKDEYIAPREPVLLDIKPARYLSIQGKGDPGDEPFQIAMAALYNVAFTVKMARKLDGRDYAISKLEGLFWGRAGREFQEEPKASWHWRLLIRVPDWIQPRETAQAVDTLIKKGRPRDVANVELTSLNEGRCVQMLHAGPYDHEGETVRRMLNFAAGHRLAPHGKHHEIYLSDPKRIVASKLRTILRYPVA